MSHSEDETQPPSDMDSDDLGDDPDERVQGRGLSKPSWALDGRQAMSFNKFGIPVGEFAKDFHRYVSALAKNTNMVPINVFDWRQMDAAKLDFAWKTISDTIAWTTEQLGTQPTDELGTQPTDDELGNQPTEQNGTIEVHRDIRPLVREKTLSYLNARWRDYKKNLKKKLYEPNKAKPRPLRCPDSCIPPTQWEDLVTLWDSETNQAIAATNKKNRGNLKLKHTVGTKSYAVMKENYKAIHGHYPDPLTFYEMAHKNASGTYINDDAAAHMATMQEKLAAMPEEVRETPEAREKIFHEHFKEKNGHGTVFQEGHGVTPNEVHSTASSSFSLSRRRISNAQMEQERLEQMMAEWREQMAKEREEQLVREQAEKAIEREALKNELRQELRTEFQMASRQEYQQMYGIPWQSMPPDMSFTQSLVGADTQLPMHGFLPTLRPSPSYGVFPPFNTNVPYNFSGNDRSNDQEEDA